MNIYNSENKNGFIDFKPEPGFNIEEQIIKLKKELNAYIIAHFYQIAEIQEIADFVGDSLAMAQIAAKTDADILVVAGVHFMAETAKILSPQKKVLLPDLNAGCSLADSCPADSFKAFINNYPDHTVITYVNTTAEIKAMSDITCTSTNAKLIVDSLPKDEKIIFAPDKHLGDYINKQTGRNMVLWDGACHVHQQFSLEKIIELKNEHPDAKLLAHPECNNAVLILADHIGSTSALLDYSIQNPASKFIVATESGIMHQMRKESPKKLFIPAPPEDSTCACNDCNYMKLNTMNKLYACLKYQKPEVILNQDIISKAYKPIKRMLDISEEIKMK